MSKYKFYIVQHYYALRGSRFRLQGTTLQPATLMINLFMKTVQGELMAKTRVTDINIHNSVVKVISYVREYNYKQNISSDVSVVSRTM